MSGPYWWVTGKIDGKMQLLGKYDSEEEADDMGFKAFKNSPYEKYLLTTSNRSEAVRRLKHVLLDSTGDLQESIKPFHHTIHKRTIKEAEVG